MRACLVDTRVWLWLHTERGRFAPSLLAELESAERLMLSAASTWEIAIKYALGKLALPQEAAKYVPRRIRVSGTMLVPIEVTHTLRASALPMHHRDPFDRLLIAQAQLLRVPIVTADRAFDPYDVRTIKV